MKKKEIHTFQKILSKYNMPTEDEIDLDYLSNGSVEKLAKDMKKLGWE